MAVKNSPQELINKVLSSGGVLYINGCRVFVDNPDDYECLEPATGFWIRNAMGWKTYFRCPDRRKAQEACNALFGAGAYTVNSKI